MFSTAYSLQNSREENHHSQDALCSHSDFRLPTSLGFISCSEDTCPMNQQSKTSFTKLHFLFSFKHISDLMSMITLSNQVNIPCN